MTSKRKLTKEQLAAMTPEEKLELIAVLDEKQRRKRDQRAVYKPNSGQLLMHQSRAKIRFNLSANAAGKSTAAMQEAMWACNGYNPILDEYTKVPANVVIVLDQPSKVQDIYLNRNGMQKWFVITEDQYRRDGKPYVSRIVFPNGSQIRFLFHDMEPMIFEGIECDFVIYDEPVARAIFISLLRGGRTKGTRARHLFIGTPIGSHSAWIRDYHDEWKAGEHPDLEFFQMSSDVNRANLAEGFIEDFAKHLTEREKQARLHGQYFDTDALALAELWKPDVHLIKLEDLPADYKTRFSYVIAADPHPSKKLAACLLGVDENNVRYYIDEFHQKILPEHFANWLRDNWLRDYNVIDLIVDSSAQADYTGGQGFRSWVEVMRINNIRFRATTYDEKSDEKFLERIKDSLILNEDRTPRMKVLQHCYRIVHNIKNVGWQPIKGTEMFKPKLEIGEWDHLACLKYALAANLTAGNAHRKPKMYINAKPALMGNSKQPGYLQKKVVYNRHRGRPLDDDDDF